MDLGKTNKSTSRLHVSTPFCRLGPHRSYIYACSHPPRACRFNSRHPQHRHVGAGYVGEGRGGLVPCMSCSLLGCFGVCFIVALHSSHTCMVCFIVALHSSHTCMVCSIVALHSSHTCMVCFLSPSTPLSHAAYCALGCEIIGVSSTSRSRTECMYYACTRAPCGLGWGATAGSLYAVCTHYSAQ